MIKLVVWGTGKTAIKVLKQLKDEVEVVAFVDSYKKQEMFSGKRVVLPQDMSNIDFDYILVASVFNESISNVLENISPNKGGKPIIPNLTKW